mmetsp:Transcript_17068/g.53302  ORF Transcript_17068/g.53302 Transcript_17068/m.53302 type:complete len:285 (-) Transcript_17068:361-1215(-)
MSELQRIARICKFKNWDLFLEHEECSRAQRRTVFIGDVVVRDRSTNEILLKAHDVNTSKRQLLRTCCEKLMCRLEMRQAEREMKSHTETQKKKAQMYLDEAYDDVSPSPKRTTERLTMKALGKLDSAPEITLEKLSPAKFSSSSLDDTPDVPSRKPSKSSVASHEADEEEEDEEEDDDAATLRPESKDKSEEAFEDPRSLPRSESDFPTSSSSSASSVTMSAADDAPPATVHAEESTHDRSENIEVDKSLEEEFKQLPAQAKQHLRAILARRESRNKLAPPQCM